MFGDRQIRAIRVGENQFGVHKSGSNSRPIIACFVGFWAATSLLPALQAEIQTPSAESCREALLHGDYETVITQCRLAIEQRRYGESWRIWKARAELRTGDYRAAAKTVEAALQRYGWSLELRWWAYQVYRRTGQHGRARQLLQEIDRTASESPWRYSGASQLLILGHAALEVGADPKAVLNGFYHRAQQADPSLPEPALAIGELALDKHDRELAADVFKDLVKQFPTHPEAHFGLARAIAAADPGGSMQALNKTLELNPNHVGAMLYRAEMEMDSERSRQAHVWLERALAINPHSTPAWALKAALASGSLDPRCANQFRSTALAHNPLDPQVDYLIGRRLSRKYRFAEAAECQRAALAVDPYFTPAQIQLSQDLLRLGQEEEGWQLCEAAHQSDQYDSLAFNLLQLRDHLRTFETIESEHFVIRMEAREAAVYGPRALRLLESAYAVLGPRYGVELTRPVLVEIFPDPADFAVRTFGVPGVQGFLGVCFGNVITANSPASQGANPSNWEATLWHEFAHVMTLTRTQQRIPRWLSEGLSVYEEVRRDSRWGQPVLPEYRSRILAGKMTPVRELSHVFLQSTSPVDTQFAYYQSYLLVKFIEEQFGHDQLLAILDDLAHGLSINDTLERNLTQLDLLQAAFDEYARQQISQGAAAEFWRRPEQFDQWLQKPESEFTAWVAEEPVNAVAGRTCVERLIKSGQWSEAATELRRLMAADTAGQMARWTLQRLAQCYRETQQESSERAALERLIQIDATAPDALQRLIELDQQAGNWQAVLRHASRLQQVNPMLLNSWQAQLEAAREIQAGEACTEACRALLALESGNAAQLHFWMAEQLIDTDPPAARRHVLQAIERAPRFRQAHQLLASLRASAESDSPTPD